MAVSSSYLERLAARSLVSVSKDVTWLWSLSADQCFLLLSTVWVSSKLCPENAFENLRQETMVRFPVDLSVSSLVWVPVTWLSTPEWYFICIFVKCCLLNEMNVNEKALCDEVCLKHLQILICLKSLKTVLPLLWGVWLGRAQSQILTFHP